MKDIVVKERNKSFGLMGKSKMMYKHLPSGKLVIVLNNDVTKATRSANYRNLVVDAKGNKFLVSIKHLVLVGGGEG